LVTGIALSSPFLNYLALYQNRRAMFSLKNRLFAAIVSSMNQFHRKSDFLPKGWEDMTTYTFKGPKVDNFEHVLTLSVDHGLNPAAATLREFAELKTRVILQSYSKIVVTLNTPIRLGDFEAHELILKWTPADKLVRYAQYFFALTEAGGLTFSCMYTAASFNDIRNDVKANVTALLNV
jgi:hypothetical protein